MAKASRHVRLFFRAAKSRFAEAEGLHRLGLTLGAVYLAGYTVECQLKALVLSSTPEHGQRSVLEQFRGRLGHDFAWLRGEYRAAVGGAPFPGEVTRGFFTVDDWSTNLRYSPNGVYDGDANDFMAAVRVITAWVRERI